MVGTVGSHHSPINAPPIRPGMGVKRDMAIGVSLEVFGCAAASEKRANSDGLRAGLKHSYGVKVLINYSTKSSETPHTMTDYETRAKDYGFATKEELKEAYDSPNTVVLDVRGPNEIEGSLKRAIQTTCTPSGCDALEANPSQFVPDSTATVIIYCKSGRRTWCLFVDSSAHSIFYSRCLQSQSVVN